MELWIRSQDKKCLIKAKIIKFENGCLRGATDDDGWYYDLGKYKKERALEVLDEIQTRIAILNTLEMFGSDLNNDKAKLIMNSFTEDKLKSASFPYQMPKE